MRAFISLHDPRDREIVTRALRNRGCTDFIYDANETSGPFNYAAIQVFDKEEDRLAYTVDATHPLMIDLKSFVETHPDCYVLAVTHFQCENDGRTAFEQGADWWIIDTSLSLESNWDHVRASHCLQKGTPSWDIEAANATVQQPVA